MSVRDELRECGGVPLGDGFSQDNFRTHNVIEGANIANGYCAGVALDWMRRVYGSMVDGGTLVSMKPTSVSTGHQIAVHQKTAEEFVLFDPNYGSFRCSATALVKCLKQPFWRPYLYHEGNGNSGY